MWPGRGHRAEIAWVTLTSITCVCSGPLKSLSNFTFLVTSENKSLAGWNSRGAAGVYGK
jgi:hypothetical protein